MCEKTEYLRYQFVMSADCNLALDQHGCQNRAQVFFNLNLGSCDRRENNDIMPLDA